MRVAALLHDIGHVPFSHTLEDEHIIPDKHDREARLDTSLGLLMDELPDRLKKLAEEARPILDSIASDDQTKKDWPQTSSETQFGRTCSLTLAPTPGGPE